MSGNRVVFPSFRSDEYTPNEVRQLVSALELRFQCLESNQDLSTSSTASSDLDFLDDRYSQLNHQHVEDDITNLQNYLTNINAESIFDLSDVSGSPSLNDTLVWNGTTFVTQAGLGAVGLDDLTDVTILTPLQDQVIKYNDITQVFENVTLTASDLGDINLSGGLQYDLMFKSSPTNWTPTLGVLQWNPDNDYLQLANSHSINWLDTTTPSPLSKEFLVFEAGVGSGGEVEVHHYSNHVDTNSSVADDMAFDTIHTTMDGPTAALTVGDQYLFVAQGYYGCDSGSTPSQPTDVITRLTYGASTLASAGSVERTHAASGAPDTGQQVGSATVQTITDQADDVLFESQTAASPNNSTTGVYSNVWVMNLTELGAANWATATPVPQGSLINNTEDVFFDVGSPLVLGDGVSDYVVFLTYAVEISTIGGVNTDYHAHLSVDGGPFTDAPLWDLGETGQHTGDEYVNVGVIMVPAPAANTELQFKGMWASASGFDNTNGDVEIAVSAVVINVSAFSEHHMVFDDDVTDIGPSLITEILTDNFTSASTSGEWGFIGGISSLFLSSGFDALSEMRVEINSGGDFDCSGNFDVANEGDHGDRILHALTPIGVEFTIDPADDVNLGLWIDPPPSISTDGLGAGGQVAFNYRVAQPNPDAFTVGNVEYRTDILGTTVRFPSAAETEWIEVSHDGTDFDVDHEGTTGINFNGMQLNLFDTTAVAGIAMFQGTTNTSFLPIAGGIRFDFLAWQNVRVRDGATFEIMDAADANKAVFSHDGTDFNAAFNVVGSTTDWNVFGIDAFNVISANNDGVRVWDSGNTDYLALYHDGTDSWIDTLNSTDLNISNQFTALRASANIIADVGHEITFYGPGGVNFGSFSHDDTDARLLFSGTGNYNITGLTGGVVIDSNLSIEAADARLYIEETGVAADEGTWLLQANASQLNFYCANDARGSFNSFMRVNRTGFQPDNLAFFDMDGGVFVYDQTNTDYIRFRETGALARIETNTNDLQLVPGGTYAGVLGGKEWRVFDTAGTSYVAQSHDGTDFHSIYTSTTTAFQTGAAAYTFNAEQNVNTTLNIGEATTLRGDSQDGRLRLYGEDSSVIKNTILLQTGGHLQIFGSDSGVDVQVAGGGDLDLLAGGTFRIRDSGNTDFAEFSHDTTDFNTVFTNTADWNITGLSGAIATDSAFTVTGNIIGIEGTSSRLRLTETDATLDEGIWEFLASSDQLTVRARNDALTLDSTPIVMSRTAEVVDLIAIASTSVAITGALTATSYGGILEENLVSKIAIENITNRWIYEATATNADDGGSITMKSSNPGFNVEETDAPVDEGNWIWFYSGGNFQLRQYADDWATNDIPIEIVRSGINAAQIVFDATQVDLQQGTILNIRDSSDADIAAFSHNGIDFLTTLTGTADWIISGSTNVDIDGPDLRVLDGGTSRIFSAGNSSSVSYSHDGTDFNTVVATTTDWNITGFPVSASAGINFHGRIRANGDGTFEWGSAALHGLLTWDTNQAIVRSQGTNDLILDSATGVVIVNDGNTFRITNSDEADYAAFQHDGTDFNTDFTQTADWSITGITDINVGAVGELTSGPWVGAADGAIRYHQGSADDNVEFGLSVDDGTDFPRARFFLSHQQDTFGLQGIASVAAQTFQLWVNGTSVPVLEADDAATSFNVPVKRFTQVGMTAFATGGQANATQISRDQSVFSTVASGGDSSKLPATFAVGERVTVKNDGAAAMDVFPASGDDLGAGTNTAVSVGIGVGAIFVATVADSTWTQVL